MDHGNNGFPHSKFSILINDNHHLQCVSYLYKPCRLVKTLSKGVKNSSFKVENLNIFLEMIIIIYSVCPIFTNPPDWRKAISNGVKTHLFM